MKKLRESWQKRRKFFGSITFKWTLLTSVFIFVTFTIFCAVTYRVSTNNLVKAERNKLEDTKAEVVSRLEKSNQNLTIQNVTTLLKSSASTNQSTENDTTIESSMIRLNGFISELSQKELSVFVYNAEKKLIFQTKKNTVNSVPTGNESFKIQTWNNQSGFLATQPIYSGSTKELIGYVQMFFELSSYYTIRNELLTTLFALELIGTVVSVLLGFVLSRYFLKPLRQMTATINQIKGEPQADIRLAAIESGDEIAYLTDAFNEMLDRIQKFMEQQQQFVEDVSHELRTPVAIIEGHLKLLNRWGKDDPLVLEESLQASLQEITRMKSLVQEMLDLSRVEQVNFSTSNESSIANEVIHQTFNNFKLVYSEFTFILDDDLPKETKVAIFRNHFEQLLIILLDNAVKYSTKRKEVHVSVSSSQDMLEIAIQDYGEGISEGDLEKIFHRFYRVDKARSRYKGGNGLGLSIAQELVESYKGTISVESVLGKGTIFRVQLPIVEKKNGINAVYPTKTKAKQ